MHDKEHCFDCFSSCHTILAFPMVLLLLYNKNLRSEHNWVFCWNRKSFISIYSLPYWVCWGDIELYWFPCSPVIWPWLFTLCYTLFCIFPPTPSKHYIHLHPQAVLQGFMEKTAPKCAAAKTVQTATTSRASVFAEPASLGRAASRVEWAQHILSLCKITLWMCLAPVH